MSKRLSPQGANECSLSTPAGTSTNPHSYENRNDEGAHGGGIETKKKKVTKERGGSVWGCGRFTYTPGHTLDHRWAFLCFLVGRFTEHFRRTGFVPARCRPGSISAQGVVRSDGLGRAFGKGRHGKQRSSQAFCTIWTALSFFLLLLSSPFLHTSISHTFSSKHYMYYVSHRCSRWISGSLGGEDQGQSGATRCPPSNTTNDAAIGQKRNIPTLLRRWLCPVTRLALWPWKSPRRTWGGARCFEKARPSLVFGNHDHEPRHHPVNTFQALCRFIFKLFLNNNNGMYAHRGRQNRSHGLREAKKGLFFFLPASHESKESHT